jgi:methyltransferase family protein
MDLKAEFAKRGPWITHYVVDGVESGGSFHALEDERIDQFFELFPDVRTILELGSLEGGHTIALARHPGVERVLGIEARATNIARARFAQELLRIDNADFVEADLEKADLTAFGTFDAIFCSGLLYHLPEPWKLIGQFPHVAPRLFIWTHYTEENPDNLTMNGLRGREYEEGGRNEPLSGVSPKSFWLTLDSLKQVLMNAGFDSIQILRDDPQHCHGPAVTLSAELVQPRPEITNVISPFGGLDS